jgi:sigma-E factor negative regulatory protein RseA
MSEERDSQLSAMFDGELPGVECELLARRLTRDEALRAQWSRFSMIGAALRAERGVALHDRVALRVQAAVAKETTYGDGTVDTGATSTQPVHTRDSVKSASNARWARFARPVAGASIAAGVAAVSIMWMRTDVGPDPMLASNPAAEATESIVLTPDAAPAVLASNSPADSRTSSNGEPDVYVTPAPSSSPGIAPPARLANYVVAHSEYSGPLSRRMALLGLVAADSEIAAPGQTAAAPANDNADNAAGAADAP